MKGELNSYLIEITRDILAYKDEKGEYVVDKILDTAGQKGTGKWTSVNSLDLGMPVTLIGEAVYARCLSAMKEARVEASKILKGPKVKIDGDRKAAIEDIRQALLASKIVSYAQGFMLLREAAKEYHWDLNYGAIANVWRAGCIIRSVFLGNIKKAFDKNPESEQPAARSTTSKAYRALPGFLEASRVRTRCWPASRFRRSPRRWPFTTATAASGFRPTCCRPSAITLAPTPTSASISRAANSSTPTGPARAATFPPEPTPYRSKDAT